jgi:phosphoglucosamine mutase
MALEERDWVFGGEQSGHLIFRDLSPTGDGLLTGLRLSELVARRGPLATLADDAWRRVPQALINVPHEDYEDTAVRSLFAALQRQHALGDDDVRLLIRPSGTEPVVRIMVEASNGSFVDDFVIALGRHFSV